MSAPADFDGQPIWQIERGGGHVILRERRYKGAAFIDMRLHSGDDKRPTHKGVTIPLDAVADLARALLSFHDEHRTRGG